MIDTKDILKMVSHVLRRSRGGVDKRLIHPEREWIIGVLLAALIGVVCVSYGALFFLSREELVSRPVTPDTRETTYKKEFVDGVLQEYDARKERFNAIKESSPQSFSAQPTPSPAPEGDGAGVLRAE